MAGAEKRVLPGRATVKRHTHTHTDYGEPSNVHRSLNPSALGLRPDDHADNQGQREAEAQKL